MWPSKWYTINTEHMKRHKQVFEFFKYELFKQEIINNYYTDLLIHKWVSPFYFNLKYFPFHWVSRVTLRWYKIK